MTRLYFILTVSFLLILSCNKEDKLPSLVYTLPVTDITISEATSGGYIDENGGSAIISRGMVWSTYAKVNMSNYEGIAEEGSGIGEFTSLISGLEPDTHYYIRAFASNDAGTGYGPELTFTTGDGNIEISLATENISFFSVTAHYTVHSYGGDNIAERGFIWNSGAYDLHPTIESHTGSISRGAGNSSFSIELSGLGSYKKHLLRAYAINSTDTFYTETVSFTTLAVEDGTPGEVIDIDGNVYPTITLGGLEWMAENLRTEKFNDGTPIPHVTTNQGWYYLDSPAWCWYENDETQYGQFYGALYNMHAVLTDKLCPVGWRAPGFEEMFHHLSDYLHAEYNIFNFASETEKLTGNVLKSCRQENSPLGGVCETSDHPRWNTAQSHFGTDFFGFSALPGGYRSGNGNFLNLGERGRWWTNESYSLGKDFSVRASSGQLDITNQDKSNGLSVRCVRDVTE